MKKLKRSLVILAFITASSLAAGCVSSPSANSYPRSSTRTTFVVSYGEVVSVRAVAIDGEASGLGERSGAWIGSALGVGNGSIFSSGSWLEVAVGGVAGSIAGRAIERKLTAEQGIEVIVRLSSNETIAVVQAADIELAPGDRVQVLEGRDGSTRVQPI